MEDDLEYIDLDEIVYLNYYRTYSDNNPFVWCKLRNGCQINIEGPWALKLRNLYYAFKKRESVIEIKHAS